MGLPLVCCTLREGTKGIFDSLGYAGPFPLFHSSFAFSVLLSMKLGELGQHRKSIITKRGVMTQMLKSRSLRAKLFSVSPMIQPFHIYSHRYSSICFFTV